MTMSHGLQLSSELLVLLFILDHLDFWPKLRLMTHLKRLKYMASVESGESQQLPYLLRTKVFSMELLDQASFQVLSALVSLQLLVGLLSHAVFSFILLWQTVTSDLKQKMKFLEEIFITLVQQNSVEAFINMTWKKVFRNSKSRFRMELNQPIF